MATVAAVEQKLLRLSFFCNTFFGGYFCLFGREANRKQGEREVGMTCNKGPLRDSNQGRCRFIWHIKMPVCLHEIVAVSHCVFLIILLGGAKVRKVHPNYEKCIMVSDHGAFYTT